MEIKQLMKEDIPELLNLRIEQQKEYHECLNDEEKYIIEYTKNYIEENLNKDLFMFGLIGVIVAIGYAIVLNMLDTTIKSKEEVEKSTGMLVLTTLPACDFNDTKLTGRGGKRK